MVTSSEVRDRLQPALLDRLTDDAPDQRAESEDRRVMGKAQLRQAVLRDLGWLFNAVQPLAAESEAYPALAGSVLNFGMPAMSGQLASKIDIHMVEAQIRNAIVRFEPRILPDTLEVHAVRTSALLDTHNVIEFEIRGHLWAQPVPLEMLLRTQLDLEGGKVMLRDMAGTAPARPA